MSDLSDLRKLIGVSKSKPKLHWLGCPECLGELELVKGQLECQSCDWVGALAELKVKDG